VVEPDSLDDVKAARVESAGGLVLAVAREPGAERVIGILRLAPADQDFLDESSSLELQIDDGPRLAPLRLGGGLKSLTFVLWDGVGEPVLGPLRDLMEARDRVAVLYPLAGGGHKEVVLPAAGAKSAIAGALGVAEEVAPAAHELATARQQAVEGCLEEGRPKDRDRCFERLASCGEARTADELRSCLAGAKK
jgi:hypothetical protein